MSLNEVGQQTYIAKEQVHFGQSTRVGEEEVRKMLANYGVQVAIPVPDSRAGTGPAAPVADESRALGDNVEAPKRVSAMAEINYRISGTRSHSAGPSRYSHGTGRRHLYYSR